MTAAENMAMDDALLELKGEGRTPNTIRFLQFEPRCVLVGYYQSVAEEIRVEYCRDHGIDINRRPTGGGAILFDENQSSVVRPPRGVMTRIAEAGLGMQKPWAAVNEKGRRCRQPQEVL